MAEKPSRDNAGNANQQETRILSGARFSEDAQEPLANPALLVSGLRWSEATKPTFNRIRESLRGNSVDEASEEEAARGAPAKDAASCWSDELEEEARASVIRAVDWLCENFGSARLAKDELSSQIAKLQASQKDRLPVAITAVWEKTEKNISAHRSHLHLRRYLVGGMGAIEPPDIVSVYEELAGMGALPRELYERVYKVGQEDKVEMPRLTALLESEALAAELSGGAAKESPFMPESGSAPVKTARKNRL